MVTRDGDRFRCIVEANGGVDSVYIMRFGDDVTPQVRVTLFVGYEKTGNMIFEAISPHSLSVCGLVTAKTTEKKSAKDSEADIVPVFKNPPCPPMSAWPDGGFSRSRKKPWFT